MARFANFLLRLMSKEYVFFVRRKNDISVKSAKTIKRRRITSSTLLPLLIVSFLIIPFSNVLAAVFNITPTDVTTRALSVVWVSDEAVTSATIRIYSDIDGVVDLTSAFTITADSALVPNAHTQGIVKVTAFGLAPDTNYYIQTETITSSGLTITPVASSLLLVHTALETTKVSPSNLPIVNDVLTHDVFFPDGVTPAPGTLVFAEVDGMSAYPLTAFAGENGFAPQTAAIDTNNFFGADGRSLELIADDALKVTVFRGLICSTDFANQSFFGFRRAPGHEETPAITEVESPFNCFTSDPICDND